MRGGVNIAFSKSWLDCNKSNKIEFHDLCINRYFKESVDYHLYINWSDRNDNRNYHLIINANEFDKVSLRITHMKARNIKYSSSFKFWRHLRLPWFGSILQASSQSLHNFVHLWFTGTFQINSYNHSIIPSMSRNLFILVLINSKKILQMILLTGLRSYIDFHFVPQIWEF